MLEDDYARLRALDVQQSFLVQAPAGSGKTELLTQRVLALLAHIEESPQEILAVTFTKKAAFEMQARIIKALKVASKKILPSAAHEQKTYELATKALKNPKVAQLLTDPSQLRIKTIDAFALGLVQRLPILSQLGGAIDIETDPSKYYQAAVEYLIGHLDSDASWAKALSRLLVHYHQRIEQLIALFSELLAKREQWVSLIALKNNETWMQNLEEHYQAFMLQRLEALKEKITKHDVSRITALLEYAKQLTFPELSLLDLEQWKELSNLFITKEITFRKAVNKQQGFPAPSESKNKEERELRSYYKKLHQEVVTDFLKEADPESLAELFSEIISFPEPFFSEQQKDLLSDFMEVVPVLLASLSLEFKKNHKVDHTEVMLKAVFSLDQSESPSSILESIDARLRHILIDEFQDTAAIQYRLFELLVQEWQVGDGRTLFLVGDPMQSIYGFRGAEVSLFLRAKEKGLGPVPLTYLSLNKNFRTVANLSAWSNICFQSLFPKQEDLSTGAVPFQKAVATKAVTDDVVLSYVSLDQEEIVAMEQSLQLILNYQQQYPGRSIVILARVKRHLSPIIALLQERKVPFYSPEGCTLYEKSFVRDALSLLAACFDHENRLAWLSFLRSPFVGLVESDLLLFKDENIWEQLQNSTEIQAGIVRVVSILKDWLEARGQAPMRLWFSGLWFALGGASFCNTEQTRYEFEHFLKLLADCSLGDKVDLVKLIDLLKKESVSVGAENATVHLMSVHKAKGLEFDCVILLKIESITRGVDPKLLVWMEDVSTSSLNFLFFPKENKIAEKTWYDILEDRARKKLAYEQVRLFYVAITRAKHSVIFLSQETLEESTSARSFAYYLKNLVQAVPATRPEIIIPDHSQAQINLKRIETTWLGIQSALGRVDAPLKNTEQWQGLRVQARQQLMQALGIVTHRILEKIALSREWSVSEVVIRKSLEQSLASVTSTIDGSLEWAVSKVQEAIYNTKHSERGQWIMKQHHDAHCEWKLVRVHHNRMQTIIMDRSFIDETGIRWIVDYKLAASKEAVLEDYWQQLQRYGEWLSSIESHPIYLGLYFPLEDLWLEKPYLEDQGF